MKQKRKKLGRKLLGFLLTLAMVVGLMPGMSSVALAVDAAQSGENAYVKYFVGTKGYYYEGFAVQGKSGDAWLATTFRDEGFETAMQVEGSGSPLYFTDPKFSYGGGYTQDGVTAYITARLHSNKVLIDYTVINNNATAKTVNIGSYGDVKIGDNDYAPVSSIDGGGILMTDGTNEFKLIPGSGDSFTTSWYGESDLAKDNVFVDLNPKNPLTDEDSGLAWSWMITVPANESITKTVALSAGAANTFMIDYNANGGSGTMSSTGAEYDTTVKLEKNGFTREGYAFEGWDTDSAGTTVVYGDEAEITMPNTDTTLYAVWKAVLTVTAPTAKTLTYNGSAQELVTAGEATGGEMQYALGNATEATQPYTTSIPTATNAGTYYVWYKVVGDENHADSEPQKVTSTIAAKPEPAGAITLSGSGHVQKLGDVAAKASGKGIVIGTTGKAKRLEQFTVSLPKDTDGGIEYRAHLQRAGWGEWVEGGRPCGTTGESRRMEAVQMRLTGALAETHSVWYRVHSQTWGTLGWARDGQAAGTSGQAKRAEAVEVQVLPQGQVPEGYVEKQASYVGAVSADVHLQKVGWTGASSALEFGTTGQSRRLEAVRLSAPATPVSAGISYEAHVQKKGWMLPAAADGALAGTTGQSRRLEAVRVSLTGEAAKDGGYSVWYRVHSQTYGWLGWAHDGEPAGTTGLSKRAEAIDVQVLPQGQVPRGYDASKAACVSK